MSELLLPGKMEGGPVALYTRYDAGIDWEKSGCTPGQLENNYQKYADTLVWKENTPPIEIFCHFPTRQEMAIARHMAQLIWIDDEEKGDRYRSTKDADPTLPREVLDEFASLALARAVARLGIDDIQGWDTWPGQEQGKKQTAGGFKAIPQAVMGSNCNPLLEDVGLFLITNSEIDVAIAKQSGSQPSGDSTPSEEGTETTAEEADAPTQ